MSTSSGLVSSNMGNSRDTLDMVQPPMQYGVQDSAPLRAHSMPSMNLQDGGWTKVIQRKTKTRLEASAHKHPHRRAVRVSLGDAPHPSFLKGRCFNCLARDHRRSQCRDPPRCWSCRRFGHLARRCKENKMAARRSPSDFAGFNPRRAMSPERAGPQRRQDECVPFHNSKRVPFHNTRKERPTTPRRSLAKEMKEEEGGWPRRAEHRGSARPSCRDEELPRWPKRDEDDDNKGQGRDFRKMGWYRDGPRYSKSAEKGNERADRGRSPFRHEHRRRSNMETVVDEQTGWLNKQEQRALELLWADKGKEPEMVEEEQCSMQLTMPVRQSQLELENAQKDFVPMISSDKHAVEEDALPQPNNERHNDFGASLASFLCGIKQETLAKWIEEEFSRVVKEKSLAQVLHGTHDGTAKLHIQGDDADGIKLLEPADPEASVSERPVVSIPNSTNIQGAVAIDTTDQADDPLGLNDKDDLHTLTSSLKEKNATPPAKVNTTAVFLDQISAASSSILNSPPSELSVKKDKQKKPIKRSIRLQNKNMANRPVLQMAQEQIAKKWNLDQEDAGEAIAKKFKMPLAPDRIKEAQNLIEENFPRKARKLQKVA